MICSEPSLYLVGSAVKDQPCSCKGPDFHSLTSLWGQKCQEEKQCKGSARDIPSPHSSIPLPSGTRPYPHTQIWEQQEFVTKEGVWDLNLVHSCWLHPPPGLCHPSDSCQGQERFMWDIRKHFFMERMVRLPRQGWSPGGIKKRWMRHMGTC